MVSMASPRRPWPRGGSRWVSQTALSRQPRPSRPTLVRYSSAHCRPGLLQSFLSFFGFLKCLWIPGKWLPAPPRPPGGAPRGGPGTSSWGGGHMEATIVASSIHQHQHQDHRNQHQHNTGTSNSSTSTMTSTSTSFCPPQGGGRCGRGPTDSGFRRGCGYPSGRAGQTPLQWRSVFNPV